MRDVVVVPLVVVTAFVGFWLLMMVMPWAVATANVSECASYRWAEMHLPAHCRTQGE